MDKNKITITLTNIREQCASHLRFLNSPLFSRYIPIGLSVWILSLTAYYCINVPWLTFLDRRPDTIQLVMDALKFHWVPVFLSRLPYVFYALILSFIAMLTGNRILRWLKVDFDSNINKIIFSVPLGWSIYSIGIFYLGISGLLYKEAVYCFITMLGILSILEIKRFFKGTKSATSAWKALTITSRFKTDKSDMVFLPVIIIFIAVQLVISFCPVSWGDPVTYHMALPKLYIKHHALVHIPGFFFSTLPAHTEMLYLLGLITSGEILSNLFCFGISSIFLVSIFSIGNRYFSKGIGYLAVVIMQFIYPFSACFSAPYACAAFGLFSLLGVYAFFMWIEDLSSNEVKERREGYLYLSIICCALAAATKIQGLFFVLLFFVGFLVTVKVDRQFLRQSSGQVLKKLAWCILVVGITTLPWYIRSWWLTGNPIFPFLYDYFGTRYWNNYSNECFWAYHLPYSGAKNFSDFIRINKDLLFSEELSICARSPILVIFLIPALITLKNWNKLVRYLFFITIVYYIFFIFTAPLIRYFYAACAILSIVVAHFIIKTVWAKYLLTRIPIVLCIVALSIASFSLSVRLIEGPFFVGLGVLDQRQFLNEHFYYRVATWVNENLPKNSKVLSWWLDGYHLDREYICVEPAFQGVPDFSRINNAQTFLKSIKELGITHLLYKDHPFPRQEHVKELLDKCVFELLESGKITFIKQIGRCTIYSAVVPPDCFALDGNTISFCDESQRRYLTKGWSSTEEWGMWSKGKESLIVLNFKEPKDYRMLIKATGFSVPDKQQSIKTYLDDNILGEHTFTHPIMHFEDFEMRIPSTYIKEGNQQIRFVYNFTGSLAEHGMGPDVRQLAMGVSSIEFK